MRLPQSISRPLILIITTRARSPNYAKSRSLALSSDSHEIGLWIAAARRVSLERRGNQAIRTFNSADLARAACRIMSQLRSDTKNESTPPAYIEVVVDATTREEVEQFLQVRIAPWRILTCCTAIVAATTNDIIEKSRHRFAASICMGQQSPRSTPVPRINPLRAPGVPERLRQIPVVVGADNKR